MFWFVLAVVVIVVLWFVARQQPKPKRPTAHAAAPVVQASVKKIDDQSVVTVKYEAVPGGWRIGSNLPLPLTLVGIGQADATWLAAAASKHDYDAFKDRLVHTIAKDNVRCLEVDQWVAGAQVTVESAIQAAIADSKEWGGADELDRKDLMLDFRSEAIESLPVRPASHIATALLQGQPKDDTVDDVLLAKFADVPHLYPVLLSAIADGDKVKAIPADGYHRKEYELLAERGFLRRGDAIPLDAVLPTFTLKQLVEIAGEAAPKKFARKAAAIDFLKTLPDLRERVGKVISFRELFQLAPLEGLDATALVQSYQYAGQIAQLIRTTLFAGVESLQEINNTKEWATDGWRLDANECCPDCMKQDGKTWKRLPQRLPPFHLGCECTISAA